MSSQIKTVGVISTGIIGSSLIALYLSQGLRVLVCSSSIDAEERVTKYLQRVWPTLEASGLSPGASISNFEVVGPTLEGHYEEVDFVQENAPERLDLKQRIIAQLDAGLRAEVVIASSSSGFPASKLTAGCKKNPERVLVAHPINPPHLIPLLEVVPHPQSDPGAVDRVMAFYHSLGKRPILVREELPGFIVNRLQVALVAEAYSLVLRGVVTAEELDTCMTEALGPRWAVMGPFLTNVFGGGGGKDGFLHLGTHIAPAARVWLRDMRENSVDLSQETFEKLNGSVQEMLANHDIANLQQQRAQMMAGVLQLKKKASDSQ